MTDGPLMALDFAKVPEGEVVAAALSFGRRCKFGHYELHDPEDIDRLLKLHPGHEPLVTLVWGSEIGGKVLTRLEGLRPDNVTLCVAALNGRHWSGLIIPSAYAPVSIATAEAAHGNVPGLYRITRLPWSRREARAVFARREPEFDKYEYAYVDGPDGIIIQLHTLLTPPA